MNGGAVAIAGAVLAAGTGALMWSPNRAAMVASPASASASARPASAPSAAAQERIFLTPRQLREAIASGTLDRPVKSLLAVRAPLHFGDFSWNEQGVPSGPTWVRIDLGSQLISVFRAGHEIGTAVIVYGGDNKQTPLGKVHILGKAQNHRSSLYDAEMPYTLRLTDDGVSIHASSVRWGAATHGCIGVPLAFAQRLFAAARVGDEVVIVPAGARAARAQTS
ncbi:MAG: L,D-transpeptidase family protein [Sphingomonas sp.]